MGLLDKLLDRFLPSFLKWMGAIHTPWTHKKITGDHYYKWRDKITPGTIVMASTYGEFSNLFNPAEVKHGALYVGGNDVKYVVEAVGKGVIKTNLVKFMTTKDELLLVKLNFANHNDLKAISVAIEKYLGREYDFLFRVKNKSFYCYEVIARAIQDVFPHVKLKTTRRFGRETYDCHTFISDPEKFEVILDSRKNVDKH